MMINEAENVCHQRSDAAKTARANHFTGDFTKKALDQVEPGRRGWGKVQMEAGMTLEPGDDLGMFVSRVKCRFSVAKHRLPLWRFPSPDLGKTKINLETSDQTAPFDRKNS
jgi:hypothetical protein